MAADRNFGLRSMSRHIIATCGSLCALFVLPFYKPQPSTVGGRIFSRSLSEHVDLDYCRYTDN